MKSKTFYYTDELRDDFATTVKKKKPLPVGYKYVNDTLFERAAGFVLYRLLLKPFAWAYMKLKFRHRFVRSEGVKKLACGHLIYANHTTLLGDAFQPSLIKMRRKNYVITGEQASSLTALLPLMRAVGNIPLATSLSQSREMLRCVQRRVKENASVTVYPEAHVWPYYTDIRPFSAASFKYAVLLRCPVVCSTTCFQKRRSFKTPRIVTYVDGPFYADETLPQNERAQALRDEVYATMKARTREFSTYSPHTYVKRSRS